MAAVRTEETMELMLPVTAEDCAADWMAIARPGRTDEGKYCSTSSAAAEETAGEEVL